MRLPNLMHPILSTRHSRERGFSLLELIIAVAILTIVIGVAVRGLTQMQQIDFAQHERTDAVQETRDFIDQMVRDLHDVGYPPRAVIPGRPQCTGNSAVACTVTYFSSTRVEYEGDLDGTGTIYHVWVQLQPGPGNTCPCTLQRGALPKATLVANPGATPDYYTELNGVLNSGDGTGTNTALYSVNLTGPGSYSTYSTTDVFDAYDVNTNSVTSCTTATTCAGIASIRVTVNSVAKYADPKTNVFPVYSITSRARVNNMQSDEN